MYTQCPQCLTIFAIDEDALQASLGIVHCGQCGQRFDALRTLSNSLPAERDKPLDERETADRVPTLTQAVPPAALQSGALAGHHQSGVAPSAAMPEPEVDGPSAPTDSGGAVPSPPDIPDPDPGSDWFADFENDLTTSLLSEAMRVFPDDAVADYAWQVDELPAQAPFAVPDISTIFWGSTADIDAFEAMTGEESAYRAAAFGDRDAPEASQPTAPPWPSAPSEGSPEAAHANIDPIHLEESDHSSDPEAVQPQDDESMADVPDPAGLDAAATAPARTDEAPRANLLLAHDATETDAAESVDIEPDTDETTATGVVPDPAEPLAPVYVRPRSRRAAGVAWVLGCLLLALVLAAQLAWIKRVDLLRDPATHAWTARVCQVIACRLPPIRDLSKIELVARDVRPDPHTTGALMITATVRNDATFRQPWPVVVVELTDLDNNTVAMRRFSPAEYMPDPAKRAAGIAAGATSAVAFEVADPGRRAIAFRFSFE